MLKIVKKDEGSPKKDNLFRLFAILIALAATAVIMLFLSYNPLEVYRKMIEGSLLTVYRLTETMNKTIPLVVLSLGIAVAFRMKFWNIGAEGQLYMGAFGAALVGLNAGSLPPYLLLPLMFLVGALFGGLWALIPAFLKVKLQTSETLVTLMLNYVAIKWVSYLQYGPWRDPAQGGFPRIASFSDNAILPKLFGVHIGWIIALALVVVIHVLFKYSKLGYEISVLGESETTARYAGMSVAKITITAMLLSGGFCGAVGMMQASAVEHTLNDQLSGGLGFTAVITTWLAKLSAPMIVVVSFFFAVLLQGGAYLQSSMKIPSAVADVLQGVILFFVLGSEFFIRYRVVYRSKRQAEHQNAKEEAGA